MVESAQPQLGDDLLGSAVVKQAIFITVLWLVGCSTLSGESVSVVHAASAVPDTCSLVGPVEIGVSQPGLESDQPGIQSVSAVSPEQLEPELRDWAKQVARDWDADILLFETVVEKRPKSAVHASLWCECQAYRCAADSDTPNRVPLFALLANPGRFEGQLVVVTAWATLEYELAALFLTSEDKDHLAFESAISLNGPESLFSGIEWPYYGYLEVEGRFAQLGSRPHFGGHLAVHRVRQVSP